MLSFLGGARGCIGYRFAITECVLVHRLVSVRLGKALTSGLYRMKVIVFTLVRAFEFELAVSAQDLRPAGTFLQRPALLSEPEKGTQLPMLIRPYVNE